MVSTIVKQLPRSATKSATKSAMKKKRNYRACISLIEERNKG